MKNKIKAGILLTVLVAPALVYLFLRFGTENHFKLPRYLPKIDSTTGEPLMKRQLLPNGKMGIDTVYNQIPAWWLIDQNGQVATNSLVKDKIYVADFFFTRCGTICPKLSSQVSRIQRIFKDNDDVRFLSFSVDPEHDKPEKLREYAKKYEAIPGKWYFFTGPKTDIYQLAMRGFYLPAVDAGIMNNQTPDETFVHSEKLVLVDKSGIVRGFYDGTDKEAVERLILEMRVLLTIE
jgi:protein SCO1